MRPQNEAEKAIAKELGMYADILPHVQFYDHAEPDSAATELSGRPRFKPAVYIRLTSSDPESHPSARESLSRKATDEDKVTYAANWQHYQALSDNLKKRAPSIRLIPGITAVDVAELGALDIYNCQQLIDHADDLGELELTRAYARHIMEIGNEHHQRVDGERSEVRTDRGRQHEPAYKEHGAGSFSYQVSI